MVSTILRVDTSTTLTVSDRWLATHTSLLDGRTATLTGSSPTGTSPEKLSEPSPATSKIAKRDSTVLMAYSLSPAADSCSGWVRAVSKFRKSTSGGIATATARVAGLG